MLIFSLLPPQVIAHTNLTAEAEEKQEAVLFSEVIGGEIELYLSLNDILIENISEYIPDETTVELIEFQQNEEISEEEQLLLEEYIFIRYTKVTKVHKEEIIDGFVHKDYVVALEEAEEYKEQRINEQVTSTTSEQNVMKSNDIKEKVPLNNVTTFSKLVQETSSTSATLTGYALKQPLSIYSSPSRNTTILKTYPYGQALTYQKYNKDWFKTTITINGIQVTGYIHIHDVGDRSNASYVRGITKKKTNVYSDTNRKKVIKTFHEGEIINVRIYNNSLFEITFQSNGKTIKGFIAKSDVEVAVHSPKTLKGVGMKQPTSVYERATKSSSVLKSYHYGAVLKYKEFTTSWYEATVILNGKKSTGYISKSDIGSLNQTLTGYATKNPTTVYQKTSKKSKKLKNYKIGTVLKYQPYNNSWFKATVIINGKRVQGFIHSKDVSKNAPIINGYALQNPTVIYQQTSKKSKALKSYPKGAPLKFRAYNKDWYRATIILNGKKVSGYINSKDVSMKAPVLNGYAQKNPTYVYAKNSKKSKKLKRYPKGTKIKYRYYNSNWYRATVYIKGKKHAGYIHKNDVSFTKTSSIVNPYKTYTYHNMVNDIIQLQRMYPDLIQYKIVGKSEYGRNIYAVGIGKGKATTFINGSIHAREWISTSLNMYMIENYAKAYQANNRIKGYNVRNILNNTTIWFMPMVNPDGVTLQQQGLKAFPKKDHAKLIKYNGGSNNFKRWKANAKGVDINRNFSVDWHNQNSPKGPSYQNYRGPKPLSSKEAQTVVKFVNEINPQMTINYHSSGRILYWAYKQTGSRYTRDLTYARKVSSLTGYRLIPKGQDSKGGGFLQWFTETKKKPSLTPELAPYVGNTNPSPTKHFANIWRENQAVGLYAAQESYNLYRK